MSADLLLREFDRVANAPDVARQLRRFVLDMAVRGLLIEQDPEDGEASSILGQATVPTLERFRRTHLSKDFPDVSEVPYEVPKNWVWCRLNQVGLIIGGGTPPSGDPDNFTEGGKGIAWLTPADMAGQAALEVQHGTRDLTEKGLRSSSATLMPKGTVLFTSRAPIGYVGVAAQDITTNQGFKSLVPSSAIDSRYGAVFFRAFAPAIEAAAPATTFKEVSGKIVSRLPFPLPPLSEQKRIAAKVDELIALCDQLDASHVDRERQRVLLIERCYSSATGAEPVGKSHGVEHFWVNHLTSMTTLPHHVDALRRTILAHAVRGRLVRQDSREQPASALITEIQSRRTPVQRRSNLERTSDERSQGDLPAGWANTTIGSLFDVYVGATPSRDDPSLWNGDVPWVSSGEVAFNRIRSTRESITKSAVGDSTSRLHPPGTVMLGMIGQGKTRGQPAILEITAAHNQNCASIRVSATPIPPEFIFWVLAERYEVTRVLAEGGSQPALNGEKVRSITLALPPLAEQRRIVATIEELMALCDGLQSALDSAQAQRGMLLEAILYESLDEHIESTMSVGVAGLNV